MFAEVSLSFFFSLDINANVILCKFYIYLQRLYMFFKKNTIYNVR